MKAKTTPYAYSDEPYEGPNNPLRLFGRLDGDHRLDLLLLPFLPSREEKEVGDRGKAPYIIGLVGCLTIRRTSIDG